MSPPYIADTVRQSVTQRAQNRCEYCQTQVLLVGMPFEIEHIVPLARGGSTAEENLCLACPRCNRHKGATTECLDPASGMMTPLFHPRQNAWQDHFRWRSLGLEIEGMTAIGRATVAALHMNNPYIVRARRIWIAIGWHPPS